MAKPTNEFFGEDGPPLSIKQAAELVGISAKGIRKAIRRGELPAFIIGGREPRVAGPGLGYRIHRIDLQRWYFGDAAVPR